MGKAFKLNIRSYLFKLWPRMGAVLEARGFKLDTEYQVVGLNLTKIVLPMLYKISLYIIECPCIGQDS